MFSASGAAYSPLLVRPYVWLDASTTSTGALTTWPDKSGNGYNATQATGALQPVCTANQLNGRNTVLFTAASLQRMTLPSGLYSMFNGNYSVFCVSKANGAVLQYRLYTASQAGGSKAFLNYSVTTSDSTFGARNTFSGIQSAVYTKTNPAIISAFRNGTTESISINNGSANSDTSAVSSASIDEINIGSATGGATPLDGYIAEMIWTPLLSAVQTLAMVRYLSGKWGVAIS